MQNTTETLATEILRQEKKKATLWKVATITALVVIAKETSIIII